MDLNALRLFVDIVDAGNLSAAARKLKMTRANVSYRLKALEEELGVQLLRRTTRHVEPTPVGAGLYEHGRNILGEVAAANALISNMGKSLQGHVRLSVPTGLGHTLLSPLMVQFKQRYPDITLDVVFDNRVHNLVSEDVDVALRIISTPPDSVIATEIGTVDWVICASPAYLANHPAPRALGACFAGAILVQAIIVGFYWAIVQALNLHVPLAHLAIVVPMSLVVQMLPMSVNGFGVREATFGFYFTRLGQPLESALALSFIGAALIMLFSTSGVPFLLRRKERTV